MIFRQCCQKAVVQVIVLQAEEFDVRLRNLEVQNLGLVQDGVVLPPRGPGTDTVAPARAGLLLKDLFAVVDLSLLELVHVVPGLRSPHILPCAVQA